LGSKPRPPLFEPSEVNVARRGGDGIFSKGRGNRAIFKERRQGREKKKGVLGIYCVGRPRENGGEPPPPSGEIGHITGENEGLKQKKTQRRGQEEQITQDGHGVFKGQNDKHLTPMSEWSR